MGIMKYPDGKLISEIMGKVILDVWNCQYYFNDEKSYEDIGDIEIATSSFSLCVTLLSDGESVGIYKGELDIPISFELNPGEQARWEKESPKVLQIFKGKVVKSVDLMIDLYTDSNARVLSGIKFNMTDGSYFVYYNNGDDASVSVDSIPYSDCSNIKTYIEAIDITKVST